MKVLILNDCNDQNNCGFDMLRGVCDGIAAVHEIEWVNIADLKIHPCEKCFKCLPCGECVLPEDDAHRVGRMLFNTDALVIGLDRPGSCIGKGFQALIDRCRAIMSFQNRHGEICPWRQGRVAVVVRPQDAGFLQKSKTKGNTQHIPADLMKQLSKGGFQVIDALADGPELCHGSGLLPIEKARALGCSLSCILAV